MNCEKCGEKIVGGVWHRCPESDTKQDSDYLAILREMRDKKRSVLSDAIVGMPQATKDFILREADALDTAIAQIESPTVYAVIYMNYFPRQVDSLWFTEAGAEKRASELGDGWAVEPTSVEREKS